MNKKIKTIVTIILWSTVYLLPLIHFLIVLKADPTVTLRTIMENNYINSNNFISVTIKQIFGDNGQLPLFATATGVIHYFSYFVIITFIHICIDILLFLPNCARYIFDKMTGEKDEDSL